LLENTKLPNFGLDEPPELHSLGCPVISEKSLAMENSAETHPKNIQMFLELINANNVN